MCCVPFAKVRFTGSIYLAHTDIVDIVGADPALNRADPIRSAANIFRLSIRTCSEARYIELLPATDMETLHFTCGGYRFLFFTDWISIDT